MNARLRISADGVVELIGSVEDRLRGRSYALLRAPGALLLGVDGRGEPTDTRTALLAGDLSRIAFSDVVSLIVHGRISGVLRVYDGSATARTVVFSAGEVHGAASDRVDERLDRTAVRMGLVGREDMDDLVRAAGHPTRACRLAVERRLLSERELWSAAQEHVITLFQAILLETRGTFVLTDETDETLAVPGLSAEGLLMEAARRLDELHALPTHCAGSPGAVAARGRRGGPTPAS